MNQHATTLIPTWLSRPLFAACALVMSLGASGCAYHLGAADRQIPGGYREVSVPVFKNRTREAGVEIYFTDALIRELGRSAAAKITSKSASLVTVEGSINSITYIGGSPIQGYGIKNGSNPNGTSYETSLPTNTVLFGTYQILVDTSVRLVRNSDSKVLWEGNFHKQSTYQTPKVGIPGLTGVDGLYNQSARYQNIEAMAYDMMSEAEDRMTENF